MTEKVWHRSTFSHNRDLRIEKATGYAERDAAIDMLESLGGTKRITVAADRGYDTKDLAARCRAIRVTPHVAQHTHPGGRVSTNAQRVTRDIRPVSGSENESKSLSVGSRRSVD